MNITARVVFLDAIQAHLQGSAVADLASLFRLGELLVVRQGVNLQGVGDIPELYWDEPVLESELNNTTSFSTSFATFS